MTIAVYPGSFDPITNGHIDVARRAARIVDKLYLAVYDAPPRRLLFTTAERVAMAREALKDIANVDVCSYSGLTVDFARRVGATVIVRGLRVIADFELEYQMALMNRKLAGDIDTICFMTAQEYAFLSATIVREIAKLGGSVDGLVPAHVARALAAKYATSDQHSEHIIPAQLLRD
jgi:pantetheine-phosphate adenylyltransferase